eukprot:GEMP01012663.1.p1 GENE.GEMP01012663.1~~GEMP01012663.1.p1  ORF type:complete len:468 (+),score=49.72 GEMP01012663.1:222-1625(+)
MARVKKTNQVRTAAKAATNETPAEKVTAPVHHVRGRMMSVETIRVILTLWVIQHHFLVTYLNETWKEQILGGFLGTISRGLSMNNQAAPVAFIAISGFMTHWTSRHIAFSVSDKAGIGYFTAIVRRFNAAQVASFIKRRVGRVFFSHTIACVASIIMLWPSFVGPSQNSAVSAETVSEHLRRSLPALFGVQAWFANVDSAFTFQYTLYPNFPAWTISSLMFCWVIYPLYSTLLVKKNDMKTSVFGILFWSAVMYACYTVWPGEDSTSSTRSGVFQGFFWFPPMVIPQFAVGIYYAEIAANINFPKNALMTLVRIAMSFVGFLAFFSYMWFNAYDTDIILYGAGYQYVCWFRMHLVMVSVFLSAIGVESFLIGQFVSAPFYKLGEYSLQLYLWHAPICRLVYAFFLGPINNWPVFFNTAQFVFYFIVLVVFSIVYVDVIEKRLIAGRLRRTVDQQNVQITADDAKKGA